MKKLIILALVGVMAVSTFAGCGSKEAQIPTAADVQADLDDAGAIVFQGDYTNANGFVYTVQEKELAIQIESISDTTLDEALFIFCDATISDRDWSGTATVTAVYEDVGGAYEFRSYYFDNAAIVPAVPLNFDDPEFWNHLGQSSKVYYKMPEDKYDAIHSGVAVIKADTVKEIQVIDQIVLDDAVEEYVLRVEFLDGLVIQGDIWFDYLPRYRNTEYDGYARWQSSPTAHFERVGG